MLWILILRNPVLRVPELQKNSKWGGGFVWFMVESETPRLIGSGTQATRFRVGENLSTVTHFSFATMDYADSLDAFLCH